MSDSYWFQVQRRRLSRRRALVGSASLALGASLLAACGGDDEEEVDASGLLARRNDSSKEAKRGGVIKGFLASDVSSFDPHQQNAPSTRILGATVSRLFNVKPGLLGPSEGEMVGDLAESWEISSDGLELTVKLKPNAFWHPVAPVNGRAFDIEDARYSWNRFSQIASNRGELLNTANPEAPVLSVTTPDTKTMLFKLKYPVSGLLALLAPPNPGGLLFVPREAEGGYQVQTKIIGTGPWYLHEYNPSASLTLKRNPKHWDTTRPYVDEVQLPIVSENATGMSQLRSGGLYTYAVRAEDIIITKRDVPQLNLYKGELSSISGLAFFGWKQGSAFRDERVRQAYSLSLDRDTFIDVMADVSKFEAEGIVMETGWNTCLPCDYYRGWWLDPKSKDFGPNAFYYQHNVAEAKRLLAAAGFPNGLDLSSTWPPTGYGTDLGRKVQIMEGMAAEAGFRFKTNNPAFNVGWPEYRDARGNFEGVAYRSGQTKADPIETLVLEYSTGGAVFTIVNDGQGDPVMEDFIARGRREPDLEKRRAIVHEAQRYNAKKAHSIRAPGGASGFSLAWPVLRNFGVFQGDQRGAEYYLWVDETLAPVNKKA